MIPRPKITPRKIGMKILACECQRFVLFEGYDRGMTRLSSFFVLSKGYLGLAAFCHILTDPRTQNIPLIL